VIRIRPEQLEAFEAAARQQFRRRLHDELRARFPHECAALGDAATRAAIDGACECAIGLGLDTPASHDIFVRLSLMFGAGFERDAPWAAAALAEQSDGDANARARRLAAAAAAFLRERG
jgi:hypothetical protein